MASNIGTNAQFATTNMKPDNGEQIDSLWGQNIADNTGYLVYRDTPGPMVSWIHTVNSGINTQEIGDAPVVGTQYFRRYPEYTKLVGSYALSIQKTGVGVVKLNGTFIVNGTTIKTAEVTSTSSNGHFSTSGSIVVNISGLSNGSYYPLVFKGDLLSEFNTASGFSLNLNTWLRA